ncbi:hypothetical protein F5Y14DRAFT_417856 [Nemania sp. NC0429]|nr:hypothetical protein F5Y14DRAFT_417856 [Nemania sp. NC0429]
MCNTDLFLGVLAILFPPLAVWVKRGLCSADSIINILLCVLGYIPGLLHAWYIITKYPDPDDDYEQIPQDYEGGPGRVTYVIVQSPSPSPQPRAQQQQRPPQRSQQPKQPSQPANYGATSSSPRQNEAGSSGGGDDNHDRAPPTYAEAVKGDHKVQSDE